jgi:hydrogenase-1 operon protein HyaE
MSALLDTEPAPPPSVVSALATTPGARRLDVDDVDPFLAGPGLKILFYSGEGKRRPDAQDVAVVLRELLRAHAGSLSVGVLTDMAENRSKVRFGVVVLPTVLILRDCQVLESIARIQDWPVYAGAVRRHLV